jgi:predicted membrane-bound dolichyl-phosphate-mannose-protein mannosyltransferase
VASRGADAPTRTTWTRDGVGAILIVLALGLALRFIIAYGHGWLGIGLPPNSGLRVDVISFQGWARSLAQDGLYGFYQRPFFHDYTPGYLYVLYIVGSVGKALGGIGDLIKLPAILADAAIGWLVWSMAREIGAGRKAALLAGGLAVANPVSWFDSAVWSQVDSFGVVFLLLGVRALWRDQPERAAIWAVIAALVKPQLAILIPIVAVVTIRRALWPAGGHGRPDRDGRGGGRDSRSSEPALAGSGVLARIRRWEAATDDPVRIVTTGVVALVATFALCAPFGLSVVDTSNGTIRSGLLDQVFKTASGYPYVSVNAYNGWALASQDGLGLSTSGTWICDVVIPNPIPNGADCPTALQIGPLPAVVVGAALLFAAFLLISAVVARWPDRLTILVGLTLLAVAFFILPTRVHERYLYPFFALGAILAALSARWLIAYVAFAAATFLNMYVVLTTIYADNPGIVDWLGIGSAIRSATGVTTIALVNVGVAIWAFLQLRPGAVDRLAVDAGHGGLLDDEGDRFDEELDARRPPVPIGAPALAMAGVTTTSSRDLGDGRAWSVASGRPALGDRRPDAVAGPDAASAAASLPTWSERPSFAEAGLIGWFTSRINDRPIRADRSRELEGERHGRIDRLDVWFIAVFVVATFGVRLFRLAEPYQMHFDEVYHARTATEFLQDWRYGYSHDIYEWTHPHLAKYAMAAGLVACGDDRVSATSSLGVPVVAAATEPRHDDASLPAGRAGDRVYVATGSEVRAYDLGTRRLLDVEPVDGAVALAVDQSFDRLFIGTTAGDILAVDLTTFDALRRAGNSDSPAAPTAFTHVDGAIRSLFAGPDGDALFVATDDDRLVTLDAQAGDVLGNVDLAGISGFAPAGSGPVVTAGTGSVADPAAAASVLAEILGGDPADYEARLRAEGEQLVIGGIGSEAQRTGVDEAIEDGRLAGIAIEDVPRIAVGTSDGVAFVAPSNGTVLSTTDLDGGARGVAFVDADDPRLYVTTGGSTQDAPGAVAVVVTAGDRVKNGPILERTIPLPGAGTDVAYDPASQMIHVLGTAPDGAGSTIYVIETHANAVFADAALPFEPSAWAPDFARPYPTDDRQQILAFDAAGDVASVETGKHAFAWRLPGVIAGVLTAALLYVLARILFRRREIADLVGIFALADGMLFVQSRIGMNDAYVGLGIVAAYTLFAAIWTGTWRWRGAFWVAMPVIGIALGLALASKWVALYAIAGLVTLILIRSAVGRFLLIIGLIAATGILGHLALSVPEGTGLGNLPFVAIMVGLTAVAVVVNVLHPIAWSDDELRFVVGAPAVLASIVALGSIALKQADATIVLGPVSVTPLHVAAALAALALVAYAALFIAGRMGFGPLAAPPQPTDPAALLPPPSAPPDEGWLRPGALLGLPVAWMAICLVAIPIALYVASYIPWAFVENHRITASWPPGHTGQTLIELTKQMYDYHNNLAQGHAASSPWWAWPFDLKPVWFYQEGLAGNTTAAIYDAGNLALWWLGIPAMAFVAWQAYARRSLALALVAIGFAWQWLSWSRIDRAAFQYHYYTSLPFIVIAVAYFAAELWHGTSRRIWLFARLAAAIALVGPALFWLFDRPLCGFVGVDRAVQNSAACPPIIPQFVLTAQTLVLAVVICVAVLAVLRQLATLDVRARTGQSAARQLAPLVMTAAIALVGLVIARFVTPAPLIVADGIPVEPVAIVLGLPLALLAVFVALARDARRFVVGMVTAIIGWFVVVYPNFSALPLPTSVVNAYQGILPTYLYAFQFPSNRTVPTVPTPVIDPIPLILGGALAVLCVVLAYSAWVWRIALAERDADEANPIETGDQLAPGSPGR